MMNSMVFALAAQHVLIGLQQPCYGLQSLCSSHMW